MIAVRSSSSRIVYWKVWIDLNGNGSFLDAAENVLTAQGSSAVSEKILIPPGFEPKTTRMHITILINTPYKVPITGKD